MKSQEKVFRDPYTAEKAHEIKMQFYEDIDNEINESTQQKKITDYFKPQNDPIFVERIQNQQPRAKKAMRKYRIAVLKLPTADA